jgi:SARP family transcriptional regulator, regulator of embCAB operon
MQINVLGPLNLRAGQIDAVPTARKPRKLLALLLVNDTRIVPVSSLVTELWESSPPKSAMTTLQTYVMHLRKLLAEALQVPSATVSREVLQTRGTGYAFVVRPGELDLHEYRRLEEAGDRALLCNDDASAVRLLRQAEMLWSGSALADVEHGPLLEAEVARLEQSRMTMVERRIEAELRLGRHHTALSELAGLVSYHRFHEGLHATFMLALYRSGHRSRALEVYHRLRRTMADELGLEPSPSLQHLLRNVLLSDSSLAS